MITSIELGDFLSHEDTTIDLEDGVTIFVGENGAGKSSIIDAITFSLFGKHTRKSNKGLIRRGNNQGYAKIKFSIKDKQYEAERKIDSKGNLNATLCEVTDNNRVQIAAGERKQFRESMTEQVEKIIGMSFEKLKIASIVQQGELNSIINAKPKEFKELLNSIIGIDKLDIASESMKKITKEFREKNRTKSGYDDRQIDILENMKQENQSKLDNAINEKRNLELQKNDLDKKIDELDRKEKLEALKKDKIKQLEDKEDELSEYVKKEIGEIQKEIGRDRKIIENCEGCFEKLKQKKDFDGKFKKATEEEEKAIKEIKEIGEQIVSLEAKQALKKDKIKQLEDKEDELSEYVKKEIGEIQKEIGRDRKIIENCEGCFEKLKQKKDFDGKFKKATEEEEKAIKEIKEIGEQIVSFKEQEKLAKKLQLKDNKCPVCDSIVEKLNPDFQNKNLKEKLIKLKQDVDSKETDKENYVQEKNKVSDKLKEIRDAETTLKLHSINNEEKLVAIQKNIEVKKKKLPLADSESLEEISQIDEHAKSIVERILTLKSKTEGFDEAEFNQKLIKLKQDVDSKETDKENYVQEKNKVSDKLKEIRDAETTLKLHSINNEEKLVAIQKNIEVKKKKLPLADSESLEEISQIDEHAKSIVERILTLKSKTEGFDEAEFENLKDEIKKTKKKLDEIKEQVGGVKLKILEAEEQSIDTGKSIRELEKVKDYISRLDKIQNNVFSRDGSVATSLRSWALNSISIKASEYLSVLNTKIQRIALSEKTRDVSIACYSKTEVLELESLSGGEKVSVALALRLGMANLLGSSNLNLMILDEPTTHLDAERKKSLVEVLTQLSGIGKSQTPMQFLIITHDAEIFENEHVGQVHEFKSTEEGSKVTEL